MDELQPRRGPGRPPKYETAHGGGGGGGGAGGAAGEAGYASVGSGGGSVATEPSRPARPSRKPFGAMEQKLAYPDRPGFHRHWFNDIPGRVQRATEAGYEYVKDREGKNVSKIVGTAEGGGPLHAYLLEIPEEWWNEDMIEQQRQIDEKEESIKRGELESKPGDGRYIPKQGISIRSSASGTGQ